MSRYLAGPRDPGLKQVLHRDADLALDRADGLLQRPCEQRVRFLNPDRELQLVVSIKNGRPP
jgi:hypothetical protein